MSETETSAFVPVLTVMVDYGNAPFLWLVERPDQGGVGGMLCESGGWKDWAYRTKKEPRIAKPYAARV